MGFKWLFEMASPQNLGQFSLNDIFKLETINIKDHNVKEKILSRIYYQGTIFPKLLFGVVGGAEEKKTLTAISKQLFKVVFSTFCEQKENQNVFRKHFCICWC